MPRVSTHDAVLYAANDLITALTKPQLNHSGISIGYDQIVALRKLATIFQCSIQKKPIAEPREQDRPPQQRPHTRSQTKALANAAICAPLGPNICQPDPRPLDDPKHEEDINPDHLAHIQHHDIPRIVPIIKTFTSQISYKT